MHLDSFSIIVSLLGILISVCTWIGLKIIKPITQMYRDWFGEPPRPDVGDPGRQGVLQRIHAVDMGNLEIIRRQDMASEEQLLLKSRVGALEKQLYPNGGSSMADKINAIAEAVAHAPTPQENGDVRAVHA